MGGEQGQPWDVRMAMRGEQRQPWDVRGGCEGREGVAVGCGRLPCGAVVRGDHEETS